MISRDAFKRATIAKCDSLCGSYEEFANESDPHAIAAVLRRYSGWKVDHVYDGHYRCTCLGCLSRARAAA